MFMKLKKLEIFCMELFNSSLKNVVLLHQHLRQMKKYFFDFYVIVCFSLWYVYAGSEKKKFQTGNIY